MTKAAELAKMGEVLTNSQIGGRRNIIYNGGQQIAQRSTSVTGLGADANAYQTVDRWRFLTNGTAGRYTLSQSTDTPNGFSFSTKIDVTTADTSIAAGEYFFIRQLLEGQDVQQLKKGTSDAEKVTVSFYVKGNANATYLVELEDADNGRLNSQTFNVTTSWTRVIKTFTADTTGALDNDTANSFNLGFWFHAGSTFTGGTHTSNTWASNSTTANRVSSGITSIFDSTDREFYITGIQLEVGEQATPFEHRSFGEELNLCRRYFTVLADGNRSVSEAICQGSYYTASILFHTVVLPVEMRAQPSMITANGTNYYITFANGGGDHHDAIARSGNSSKSVVEITAETNVSATAGHSCFTRIGGTSADAKCMLEAEL